jgi:hypothetical protein
MPTLLLKFGIVLEEFGTDSYKDRKEDRYHGPLFHKWLPDGQKDALTLNTGDPNTTLKVWFERKGIVKNGHIIFDYKRQEVDPDIIPKQQVLDAGPLRGKLEIQSLSNEQIAAVQENKVGDPQYIALGKRIIKLVYPPFSRLINTLRTNYGQYWIKDLERWDSRNQSLGGYLYSTIYTEWSIDDGNTWSKFIPTDLRFGMTILDRPAKRGYEDYLTSEDWNNVGELINEGYEPSPAAFVLTRAIELFDQKHFKQSLIEGVTALEIGLGEFARRKIKGDKQITERIKSFWELSLPAKLIIIGSISGEFPIEDIQAVIKAIEARNKAVHEGSELSENIYPYSLQLLHTVASLIYGPKHKLPAYRVIVLPGEREKES